MAQKNAGMFGGNSLTTTNVVIGSPPLSFYAVQGAVVGNVLSRAGASVSFVREFHETIYPKIGSGEIDVFVASWLPSGHSEFWKSVKNNARQMGEIFDGGAFFLAVPDYVHENEVSSISDLRDASFEKQIVSVGPGGAVLTNRANEALDDYGLREAGYEIDAREEADWVSHTLQAYGEGRKFAIAIWQPCFLNDQVSLRRLTDPDLSMGPDDTGWIIANTGFLAGAPAWIHALLANINLGIPTITKLDKRIVIDGLSPDDAAEEWVQNNAARVDAWIAAALEKKSA
ncbi:glycine betaine ABC transporter substrate-binding protein [uncultured Ruegeria sp.]|uniref:glycine betaine ABC transporter substrate-binding protein n=1 Tax=uncultured Ruegeria sp. TaxID=259304 RepID=UPI00260A5506|nr:glycine betaine ABC transporter substrate-binding protein [uncultured Ruegeria sp.]